MADWAAISQFPQGHYPADTASDLYICARTELGFQQRPGSRSDVSGGRAAHCLCAGCPNAHWNPCYREVLAAQSADLTEAPDEGRYLDRDWVPRHPRTSAIRRARRADRSSYFSGSNRKLFRKYPARWRYRRLFQRRSTMEANNVIGHDASPPLACAIVCRV